MVPLLENEDYEQDCLQYVDSLVKWGCVWVLLIRHPFSKENRSTVKELIPFLIRIHRFLSSRSLSSDYSLRIDEFDSILITFLQTQMKSFFPIRSSAEMALYTQLFVLLIDCVKVSSLSQVIELLGVVRTLLPSGQDEQTLYLLFLCLT